MLGCELMPAEPRQGRAKRQGCCFESGRLAAVGHTCEGCSDGLREGGTESKTELGSEMEDGVKAKERDERAEGSRSAGAFEARRLRTASQTFAARSRLQFAPVDLAV
eukprot:6197374-Pleurochrysis_carterae.AAC.1